MKYKHVFNLALYEPKWWERILLKLLPLKEQASQDCVVYYQTFFNRFYLHLVMRFIQPEQPVTQSAKPMPGFDNPWEN